MKKILFVTSVLVVLVFSLFLADLQQADAQGTPYIMWIPVQSFHLIGDFVSAGSAGAPIGALPAGVVGLAVASDDVVGTLFPWPSHLHNKMYAVAYRIWWTGDGTTDATNVDWLLSVEEQDMKGEDALVAATVGTLADDIAFAADAITVQNGVQTTTWDTVGVTAHSTYNNDSLVQMVVEMEDDGATGAEEPHFLGVQIFFVPKDFKGDNYHVPGSTSNSIAHGISLPRRAGF